MKEVDVARPKKDIDPEQVERIAQTYATMEEIAYIVGCSVDTLERRFADVIKKERAAIKISLRRKQITEALAGNTTMLVWLGKVYLGQSDKQDIIVQTNTRTPETDAVINDALGLLKKVST